MSRPPLVQCGFVIPRLKRRCGNWTRSPYCYLHEARAVSTTTTITTTTSTTALPTATSPTKEEDDTCPICLRVTQIQRFSCSHGVCSECRSSMRDFTCPLCRACIAGSLAENELKIILQRRVDDLVERRAQELETLLARELHEDLAFLRRLYDQEFERLQSQLADRTRTIQELSAEIQRLRLSRQRHQHQG